jgi:hypothetical protein
MKAFFYASSGSDNGNDRSDRSGSNGNDRSGRSGSGNGSSTLMLDVLVGNLNLAVTLLL